MPNGALSSFVVLLLVVASLVWMAVDVTTRQSHGRPVVATLGPLTLETPGQWLSAGLLLWIVVFPLYVVARKPS